MEAPIYSKIEFQNAVSAKRNMLTMQINLLNTLKNIENYKSLRKKELIAKIKLKNDLKYVKEKISKINEHLPHTKKINKPTMIHAEMWEKEAKRNSSIEEQLLSIKKRLSELQ